MMLGLKRRLYPVWLGGHFVLLRWAGRFPSQSVRHWIYRRYGLRLEPTAVVYGGCELREPSGIRIGRGTSIGHDCILDGRLGLEIGEQVNVSSRVSIWTMQHDYRDPDFGTSGGPVRVGRWAWLSNQSIVLPGITIGEGAVVAAGAVVTRDVPEYTVVAGIPAKPVAERPRELRYTLGSCMWFA